MKEITTTDELRQALEASDQQAVFIFKHSTRCGTSAGALSTVNQFIAKASPEALPPFYMVKVVESRPLSNQVAVDLGVPHQSPQLILVKERKAVWIASHYGIQADRIGEAIVEFSKETV